MLFTRPLRSIRQASVVGSHRCIWYWISTISVKRGYGESPFIASCKLRFFTDQYGWKFNYLITFSRSLLYQIWRKSVQWYRYWYWITGRFADTTSTKAFFLLCRVCLIIRIMADAQGSESCRGLFMRDCISALSSEHKFSLMTFMMLTEIFQSLSEH
jgi:hypothetical protein